MSRDDAPREVALTCASGKVLYVGLIDEDIEVQQASGRRPVKVHAYDDRYLDFIVDWIHDQVANGFDVVIMYTGERRFGKSTIALRIARKIDPGFPVANVAFRLSDFRRVLSANPRADPEAGVWPQVMLDEAGYDLYKGDWMTAISKQMVKNFQVLGEKRQVIHLVLPHADFLNTKVHQGIARMWLDVDLWQKQRGYSEVRLGKRNKWLLERYWEPWAICMFDPIPHDDPWWLSYTAKKQAFIDESLAQDEAVDAGEKHTKQTEQRDRAIRLLYQSIGGPQSAVAQLLKMPEGTVRRVLSKKN